MIKNSLSSTESFLSLINIVRIHQDNVHLEGLSVAPDGKIHAVAHGKGIFDLEYIIAGVDFLTAYGNDNISGENALCLGIGALGNLRHIQARS